MARATPQITATKKAAVPALFAQLGTVTAATKAAGVERNMHYDWMKSDPEYAAAFNAAERAFADRLEAEMYRRAVEGVEEPWTLDKEGNVLLRRKYSDTLLIFALKGALPEKYKERPDTTAITNLAPVQIVINPPANGVSSGL